MNASAFFLCIAVALLILLLAICLFVFNNVVWRKTISLPKFIMKMIAGNEMPTDYDADFDKAYHLFAELPFEKITLTAPDGAKLVGRILVPEKSNGRLIIACHGARSSGLGEFAFMGFDLHKSGYTLVLPDHRGCGESDGKFLGYGTHESRDTLLWLDLAKKRFPDLNIYLLGVSMGGAAVLMMSPEAKSNGIKAIVADCPYTSAWEEFSYQLKTSFHLPEFPVLHICDLYSRIFAGYSFKAASPREAVKKASVPILFIHGTADEFVPCFMQDELYNDCAGEKYKLAVKGAVHARSYYKSPKEYFSAVEEFFNKEEHRCKHQQPPKNVM